MLAGRILVTLVAGLALASSACAAAPSTHLVVVYRPHGQYPKPGQSAPRHRWTLSCDPARGTHPARSTACRELAAHRADLTHPGPQCMVIVRGGPSATVDGTLKGHALHFTSSTCSRAWKTLPALLTGSDRD